METGYYDQQMGAENFGPFPSVNPLAKKKTEHTHEKLEGSGLSIACAQGDLDEVKSLIREGYDIDKKDPANLTPIIRAATNGHKKVVEYLVNNGAKISYDLLYSVKTKVDILEERAKANKEDIDVASWKDFLDYLISEGKKQ